ncbi:unnamed protein product [Durusdinium trenchii]|uniref:Uncharacterized protein n=2 Tax=Durusdinium trenchii TaxID=1381693 RepID=A0ABP0HW65_9DINO
MDSELLRYTYGIVFSLSVCLRSNSVCDPSQYRAMSAWKRDGETSSESRSVRDVSENDARDFVERFLSGRLTPAGGRSRSKTAAGEVAKPKTSALSYHLPKTHGEHKCRSGRFARTYTGGGVTYYPTTQRLVLRSASKKSNVDIFQLWDLYQQDKRPLWQQVRERPQDFHNEKMDSGRYRNQRFKTCYKKKGYAAFALANPSYYQQSLRMRMFYEYCVGLKEAEENPQPGGTDSTKTAPKAKKTATKATKASAASKSKSRKRKAKEVDEP